MEFFQENIRLGEVIVQLIAFVIVFWVMKLLAWKPILRSLDARKERIKKQLDDLEHAKKDIEKLRAETQAQFQKIEDEARGKLQEAVQEGLQIAKQIQEKARVDSQAIFEKAKTNIELETAKARLELRQEIVTLAINASERVLNEKMKSDEAQQAKVAEIIGELEKTL